MSTRFSPATLLCLAALLTVPAFAQAPVPVEAVPAAPATNAPADPNRPATEPATTAATAATTATPAPAGTATKGRTVGGLETLQVDFPDTDVREILRNVADLFDLNIIMPEALQGKTTIKLRDVTWRQIFENVLKPVGYTFIEEGNIIKIVSLESQAQEPVGTDVFIINYARAADLVPTITSLVDAAAGGKIVVDARTNSLVITERPSRMGRIRPIIEQLDRATDQVMIEAKFVEVTDSDVKNIGVNWASLANYRIGAGNLGGSVSRTRGQDSSQGFDNTITSGTDSQNVRTNTTQNSNNTVQANTSNNGGTVTSTNGTPSSTSTTGTNTQLTNTVNNNATTGLTDTLTTTAGSVLNNLLSLTNTGNTTRDLTAVFSANDFNLVLSALQTLQDTKVVSNPTIVTLNNNEAVINVGEERPIPSYTYSQERGTYEVSGFTWKSLGVILKVTPQVNGRGDIKLTVAPEVSQSTRDANFQGASIPIVETRKATTTVSMKDGYTMGIGGLLRTSTRDTSNKVPVLGSVPVLGRLFGHKAKNHDSSNLIIFITAKTLSSSGAPLEQVFDSERVRQLNMRREDLPGYRDGSSPFINDAPTASRAAPASKKK